MVAASSKPLLMELGTEELPPKALDDLAAAFASGISEGLVKAGVLENSDNKIVLGFTNIQMAERAGFNAMRDRHFLGFSDKDFADTRLKELLSSGFDLV